MNKLILILLLALAAFGAFAVIDVDGEVSSYTGVAAIIDGHPWVQTEYGDKFRLLLAPKAILDTLGLAIAEGDSLVAEGIVEGELMLVGRIFLGTGEDMTLFILRDFNTGEVYPGGATYNVVAKNCIGCRLCLAPCPTGAITMVKGKAVIDPDKCTECGICIEGRGSFRGCPVGAIKKE
jgi:ferredoxin